MSLLDEINAAVADGLAKLATSHAWRTYSGPAQNHLMETLAELVGCRHVGLASSGSAALEMLLQACRLRAGDEVMLSGYDYPGNFAAVERVGARPALVDVEAHSWNLSWESLEATYSPSCRVLIASHLHGQLQEIGKLHAWCREHNMLLIQDACQALGANLNGEKLGFGGDATFLSFGGSKVISAGRGGAWCTNDNPLAQHAKMAAGVGSGAWEMSELQATVALAQLPFLARITAQCRTYFGHLIPEITQHWPDAMAPWQKDLANTAFYQAGWLLQTDEPTNRPRPPQPTVETQPTLETPQISWGRGFEGFHRRSTRRCRFVGQLTNTSKLAQLTRTLHHRVAIGT
ncbi:MAG: aminotransferase class V-fold PLP-dependent enzyme [Pirellulaceae bacterium]|nr:aminotransferase class V-fold PLP-dependent enzyme [Pirellulaceae bacterium]